MSSLDDHQWPAGRVRRAAHGARDALSAAASVPCVAPDAIAVIFSFALSNKDMVALLPAVPFISLWLLGAAATLLCIVVIAGQRHVHQKMGMPGSTNTATGT